MDIFSQGGSETSDGRDPFGWDFDKIDSEGDEAAMITTQSSNANPFGEDDNGGSGGSDDAWFGSGEDDDDTWDDDDGDDDFFS